MDGVPVFDFVLLGIGEDGHTSVSYTHLMADIFEQWNKGRLHSYLIEITSAILRHKEQGGGYLLDNIPVSYTHLLYMPNLPEDWAYKG